VTDTFEPPSEVSPPEPSGPSAPRDDLIDELAVEAVPMGPPPPAPGPPPEGLGRGGGGAGEGTIGLGTFGTFRSTGPPLPPQRVVLDPDDPAPECDYRCRASEHRVRVSAIRTSATAITLRGRWEGVQRALEECFQQARVADPCVGDQAEIELVVVRGGPVAVPGAPLSWVSCALERIIPMRIDAALPEDATSGRVSVRVTFTPAERRWSMPGRIVVQPVSMSVCEPSDG
jgi:hypothetical protein